MNISYRRDDKNFSITKEFQLPMQIDIYNAKRGRKKPMVILLENFTLLSIKTTLCTALQPPSFFF